MVVSTGSLPCAKHPGRLAPDLEVECIVRACEGAEIRPRDLEAIVLVPPGYRRGFAQIRAQPGKWNFASASAVTQKPT